MFGSKKSLRLPTEDEVLPGRLDEMPINRPHFVDGHGLKPPFPPAMEQAMFGMGCFWGAEKQFWSLPGIYVTAVGYAAGFTPNPTYREVCSGLTGHNEVVLVVFDPSVIRFEQLLKVFWEHHDPTQGMRQGNDMGTQYRSGIYTCNDSQHDAAHASKASYEAALNVAGYGAITTEIMPVFNFFYAEEYHQQYLAKNPDGYCGLGGIGVGCDTSNL